MSYLVKIVVSATRSSPGTMRVGAAGSNPELGSEQNLERLPKASGI